MIIIIEKEGVSMTYIHHRDIVYAINSDFQKNYPAIKTSGVIWDECMKAVNDPKLMNYIIYRNDEFKIPPVKTFLEVNKTLTGDFTAHESQTIGKFWGFIFQIVFNKKRIPGTTIEIKDVGGASYYEGVNNDIIVI